MFKQTEEERLNAIRKFKHDVSEMLKIKNEKGEKDFQIQLDPIYESPSYKKPKNKSYGTLKRR